MRDRTGRVFSKKRRPVRTREYTFHLLSQAAGNRTRATSPPGLRTATIRQPDSINEKYDYTAAISPLWNGSLPLYDGLKLMSYVGPPGIEPGLYEPESYVLPVYYGPT